MKNKYLFLDSIGAFASSLCALHCSITPFFITLLPFLGLSFLENELFENTMIAIAIFLGIISLLPSYLKKHNNIKPIILFFSGISLIISSHLFFHENLEHIYNFPLKMQHLLNLKYRLSGFFRLLVKYLQCFTNKYFTKMQQFNRIN